MNLPGIPRDNHRTIFCREFVGVLFLTLLASVPLAAAEPSANDLSKAAATPSSQSNVPDAAPQHKPEITPEKNNAATQEQKSAKEAVSPTAGKDEPVSFKLKPREGVVSIPEQDFYVRFLSLSDKPLKNLKAEPKYQSTKPLYGKLELGIGTDNKVAVVVDEVEGEKSGIKKLRIFVDRNRDRDLTNDGSGEIFSNVTIDAPYLSGSVPYVVSFFRWRDRPDFLAYRANTCREGEIELDGKQYKIVVQDENFDGRFDDLEHGVLLIDINRDGVFEGTRYITGDVSSAELFKLKEPFNVGGKVWEVASLSPDGLTITLRQSAANVAPKPYLTPGNKIPDFTASDIDGKPVNLKQEATKAKYVLLHFWSFSASGLPTDLREICKLYAQYREQGLQIIGIHQDCNLEEAKECIKRFLPGYPQVVDGKPRDGLGIKQRYRILGNSPYLVDKNLTIVEWGNLHRALRDGELAARLQKLLGPGDQQAAAKAEKEFAEIEKAHVTPFAKDSSIAKAFCNAKGFNAIVLPRPPSWDKLSVRSAALHLPYVYVQHRLTMGPTTCDLLIAKISKRPDGSRQLEAIGELKQVGDGSDLLVIGDALLCSKSGAIDVYSLTDPAHPTFMQTIPSDHSSEHNIFVVHDNSLFLLCAGRFSLFDVTKPLLPRFMTTLPFQPFLFLYGGYVVDGRMYLSSAQKGHWGISIYDVSKAQEPQALGFVELGDDLIYQMLPVDSKRFVATTTRAITLFSLDDPLKPAPLGAPVAFDKPSGRTAAMYTTGGRSFAIVNGTVYSVEQRELKKYGDFTWGGNADSFPYRAAVQDNCIAIPSGGFVTLLFADSNSPVQPSTLQPPPKLSQDPTPKGDAKEAVKPDFRPMQIQVFDLSKKPIADARITVRGMTDLPFGPICYQTNAEGIATIESPKKELKNYQILVMKDHYVTVGAAWDGNNINASVPDKFTFAMEPGTVFSGFVHDENGKALPNAEVVVKGHKSLTDGPRWVSINESVKTDAAGKWQVDRIPKDLVGFELKITVKRPAIAGVEQFDIKTLGIDSLRAGTAVLRLHQGAIVEGTVTDPQGKSVVGALVGLFPTLYASDFSRIATDQQGRYRFHVSEPGECTLAAVAKGFAPDHRRVIVGSKPQTVDLRLCKGEMIRLRVVDKDGKPMPRVAISTVFDNKFPDALMLEYQSTIERDKDRHMTTDADGRWEKLWLSQDELHFSISKSGYARIDRKVMPGAPECVVTLTEGGWRVSGRVLDGETKSPITKFRVVEGSAYGSSEGQVMWRGGRPVENPQGQYQVAWNDSGNSRRILRIEANGYYPSEALRIQHDKQQVTFDVALSKGPAISGVVHSPDGKPLADAEVGIATPTRLLYLRNGCMARDQMSLSVQTDAQGRFELPPQREPYILIVLHDLGFARVAGDSQVKDIVLKPWGRVEGMLQKSNIPAARKELHMINSMEHQPPKALNPAEKAAQRIVFDYQTRADDKGRFTFERVAPGSFLIMRQTKRSEDGMTFGWTPIRRAPLDVVAGQTLKVELSLEGDQDVNPKPLESSKKTPATSVAQPQPVPPSPPDKAAIEAARKVLEEVAAAYKTMETYKAEGVVKMDMDTGATKLNMETSFSILLKKPNLYLISWTQKNVIAPNFTQSGAVWSDGTQPYLYMSALNGYSKMKGDDMALGAATGGSGGAAMTMASIFLPVFKHTQTPLARLKDPKIETAEKIDGEECYVISGASFISQKETLWVSKSKHFLVKYSRSLTPPDGGFKVPEMSDKQIEEAIRSLGLEVTEENKKNMREKMEESRKRMKNMKISGTSTEIYSKISTPELKKEDFTFTPPKDAVLKESLFGEFLSGKAPQSLERKEPPRREQKKPAPAREMPTNSSPSVPLQGTIVDAHGTPLAGATVYPLSRHNQCFPAIKRTISNSEGRFHVDMGPDGDFHINQAAPLRVVTASGHTYDVNAKVGKETVVHVPTLLNPAVKKVEDVEVGELAGVVIDEFGKPIEGVDVDVWDWYPGNETKTDRNGIFRLKGFDRDEKVEVRLRKSGYSPEIFLEAPTGVAGWVIVLGSKTYFEGIVRGPDGKPTPHALIRADQGPRRAAGCLIGNIWTETTTDDDGRFRLYVQPDGYQFIVTAAGIGVTRFGVEALDFGQHVFLDFIKLQPGVTFRAKIVDSQTGKPVEGVRLFNWQHKQFDERSNAEGVVTITEMFPGDFSFEVEAKDYTRWWCESAKNQWQRKTIQDSVVPGTPKLHWQRNFDHLDFVLQPAMPPVEIIVEKGVHIRGQVVDPDGKTVGGATVAPALTGTGNSLTGDTRFSVTSKEDGKFDMLLPASNDAQYNLMAHDGQYEQWRTWANGVLPPIRTKPGEEINDVVLTLTRPAVVRGKVVDKQGKPLPYCEVRAHAVDNLENRYYDPTTKTNQDGAFELKFVRPGEHLIQAAPFWLRAEEAPAPSMKRVTLKATEVLADALLTSEKQP